MPLAIAALRQWPEQAPPIMPLLLRPCAWQAESRLARLRALLHGQTALMAHALAPWVERIDELQTDLWSMVENDDEDTEVRQSALAALLPVSGRYPEKRFLLGRRMNPVPDPQSAPIIPMVWALGELARIDAPTRTWLKRQLKPASKPLMRAVFLSVLHRARPRDRGVISGLLSMLVQPDFAATHIAFQALSPSLKSASLARREVREILAHGNVWIRRDAVRWLLQPADSRVRSALRASGAYGESAARADRGSASGDGSHSKPHRRYSRSPTGHPVPFRPGLGSHGQAARKEPDGALRETSELAQSAASNDRHGRVGGSRSEIRSPLPDRSAREVGNFR